MLITQGFIASDARGDTVLLGRGEALFAGLDLPALGYNVTKSTTGERATHVIITKQK